MAKSLTTHFNFASFQKVIYYPYIEEVKFWRQNHSPLWLLLKAGKKTAGECIFKYLKIFSDGWGAYTTFRGDVGIIYHLAI